MKQLLAALRMESHTGAAERYDCANFAKLRSNPRTTLREALERLLRRLCRCPARFWLARALAQTTPQHTDSQITPSPEILDRFLIAAVSTVLAVRLYLHLASPDS